MWPVHGPQSDIFSPSRYHLCVESDVCKSLPGYSGPDSFTYEASDGRGGTYTATVTSKAKK